MNNLKNHLILISTVALIISDFVYSDHSCKTALNGAGFSHDGEVNMMKLNEISKNSELYTKRSEKHELAWLNKYKYYLSTFEMNTSCCGMKLPITNNQGKNENPLGIYEFCCIETLKEIGFNENVNYNLFNLIYRIPKSYTLANLNSLDFDIEEYAAHLYPGRPSLRDVANYAEQTGNISENLLNESYSNPVVQRSGRGKSIINSNIIMYNNDYTNNIIQVLEEANSLERSSEGNKTPKGRKNKGKKKRDTSSDETQSLIGNKNDKNSRIEDILATATSENRIIQGITSYCVDKYINLQHNE